jgi:hypothetical protein
MRALIIGPDEKTAIQAAFDRARAKPIPWEVLQQMIVPEQDVAVLTLDNRGPGQKNMRPMSEQVLIPIGYRMAISFERQPAGLLAHFSFSVEAVGKVPNPESVEVLLDLVGFDLKQADSIWTEEFLIDDKPGGLAVNIVFMVDPGHGARVMGHA